MLDKSFASILKRLPLSDNINTALIQRQGDLFIYLRLIEAFETGNWVAFRFAQKRLTIDEEKIMEFYIDAIAWAEAFK